jgi:dTDP-6-deoxy-L-talose 4-dehydrogenase (NAD+)
MQTVLVTGASGFVGRSVLKALSGYPLNLRLILRKGQQNKLKGININPQVIETPDLFKEDEDWYKHVCQGVDTVIHIAWYVEPGKYLESSKNLDCLIGTLNFARGATHAGICRFIGVGTCFEYDLTDKILSTNTQLNPKTIYAATKTSAFLTLSQWFELQRIEFAWCRLFYLYGEGENSRRLVPYLRQQLADGKPAELTSGHQVRDFLEVQKAGEIIVKIAMSSVRGPVNVCSGTPITVRELAEKIAYEYGRQDLLKFGARPDNLVDPPYVVGVKTEIPVDK